MTDKKDSEFKLYYEKFEKMQRWIRNDLTNSTIKAHANFLVAMGILNYTEMLGAFVTTKAASHQRFNAAIDNLFPSQYGELKTEFNEIVQKGKKSDKGLYDCLRCGMSHEYLVKSYDDLEIQYTILGVNTELGFMRNIYVNSCGIQLVKTLDKKHYLKINNPRFIHDLDLAFEKCKQDLLLNNSKFKAQFIERAKEVKLGNFN